ncbi:MAG: metallophosphoesterase [Bacteroidetes bacterium]|nr:metallophosphoesterase [Bacteroidota bacterium]
MKKALILLVSVVFLITFTIVIHYAFPRNGYILPFFIVLFVLDGYLWSSLQNKIFSYNPVYKYLLTVIYWLPFISIFLSFIAGIFTSFVDWNIALRTYLTGMILVVYVCKFIPAFFLLIADLIRVFEYGLVAVMNGLSMSFSIISRKTGILRTGWVLGTLVFILMLSGILFGNYHFRVRETTIRLPDLPYSFNGLRIVQISDIHLGSWTCKSELQKAVNTVNALKPDVIFFTGDLLNFCTKDVDGFKPILSGMKAPYGVFAILGNHDYGEYITWSSGEDKKKDQDYLFLYFKSLGWDLMLNENQVLVRGTDSVAILGLENWGSAQRFQKRASLEDAMKGVEHVRVKLLLSHDPSYWHLVIAKFHPEIDVTFSGHTHGFQLGIECFGLKWSPSKYFYQEWAGLYEKSRIGNSPQYLYINRGLGSIGYPGRIGIWPEITLITLKNK